MPKKFVILLAALACFSALAYAGTTGKIAGTVKDAETGQPLPGVNVMLTGTTIGAATAADGYYVMPFVPAGTYTLRASTIGYTALEVTEVRVNIDLTTTINVSLKPEVLAGEEVVVVAERPVVQKDVSASTANLNIKEVEALPVVRLENVVALQAGVSYGDAGIIIRGRATDNTASQTAFVVNGIALRDERDNKPYTGISYTAIEEIQIQTGGFNAEYGNIRSGVVNVTTKEGSKDRYSFGLISRYSPTAQKHFGPSPHDRNSYWIRPFVDEAVCWTGTDNGVWDEFTRKQYAPFEGGWNAVAQKRLQNEDPNDDLSPEALRQLFLWQHRRQLDIVDPDYDFDVSLGGPMPLVSRQLKDLRFFASYRTAQSMYVIPLSRDGYRDYNLQLKLTADLSPRMKLMIEGINGRERGTNDNNAGLPGLFRSTSGIAGALNRVSYIDTRMFNTDYWAPSAITRNSLGIKLTHVLNPSTFYEATLHYFRSKYDTNPGRPRDTTPRYSFGNGLLVDEGPFGFYAFPAPGLGTPDFRMGFGMSNSRDSSKVGVWAAKFDISKQVGRFNQFKAGAEFVYTDNNVNYAQFDFYLPDNNSQSVWHTFPKRGALYLQDKLEFEGMIANLGLRLDYSHAGGDWYVIETPFDAAFSGAKADGIDTLLTKTATERKFSLSPRLGVAFPISVNSKLYFNYGHFRQLPTPDDLYLFRRAASTKEVIRIGNPNNPLQKTVAYELGYEQNMFDQYLLRLAGYYKDVSEQPRLVRYRSVRNAVNYQIVEPTNYEDIRGFEFTVSKNRGNWIQGFLNYTYQVNTFGNFGFAEYVDVKSQQLRYENDTRSHYQTKPLAQPFARANVYLFSPAAFGPKVVGWHPLENLRLNILANWSSGAYYTPPGGANITEIQNILHWKNFYNVNLRLSKSLRLANADVQLFMDVNNVFNIKYMSQGGFVNAEDYERYLKSLHYPEDISKTLRDFDAGFSPVVGSDRPGDYRTVPYEPYDPNDPDEARKQRILETKAYIDMPNQEFLTFLNPRDVFFGLQLSFNLF